MLPTSNLIVVGISNIMDLPERLMPRIESRLNLRRIRFLTYKYEEIEAIIADRLSGLDAFGNRDAVELCARKVAATSGDLRQALEICRLAAQLAEREAESGATSSGPTTHVGVQHVEDAVRKLRGSLSQQAIASAPMHQKLMLACVAKLMGTSGAAGVTETALLNRHRGVCAALHCDELPTLARHEQKDVIAQLCAPRILIESKGTLRLNDVLVDDVKAMVRAVPVLAHLA